MLKEGIIEQRKVDIDPTMGQMVKLVKKAYNINEQNGRIHIYNLFSLRNSQNGDAMLSFEQLAEVNAITPLDVISSIEELRNHRWIYFGWGTNNEKRLKHLQQIKSLWNTRLQESGIPTFGKRHNNGIDYYHLRPRLLDDQKKLTVELLDIYRTEIEKTISVRSYWVSVVYFENEYTIIIDEESFVDIEAIVTIDCESLVEIRTVIKVF